MLQQNHLNKVWFIFSFNFHLMQIRFLFIALVLFSSVTLAQKKPLDHSVYDSWQQVGEKLVTDDGRYLAYGVNVQEGDGEMIVRSADGKYSRSIPRAYQAVFSGDSKYLVARIKPLFKDTREARIKKKPAADMPKDSLVIVYLGMDSIRKIPDIKSYKMPEEGGSWLAYHTGKSAAKAAAPDSLEQLKNLLRKADSLARVADSLRNKVAEANQKGLSVLKPTRTGDNAGSKKDEKIEEGTDLVLLDLNSGKEIRFSLVSEFYFNKYGNVLLVENTGKNGDNKTLPSLLRHDLASGLTKTILNNFKDAKGYAISEDGNRVAFVADRDSSQKALKKFYSLFIHDKGFDTAVKKLDAYSSLLPAGWVVSPHFTNYFSKDGKRLFFGTAPAPLVKDTTLVDFETAKLDIWHYKDDYLQPQQLVQLNNEQRRSYLTLWENDKMTRLAEDTLELVTPSAEGVGRYAVASSSKGYRVQQQWAMDGMVKLYVVDLITGNRKLIADKVRGGGRISPAGKYIYWYDRDKKNWMAYDCNASTIRNMTKGITVPLFDEEDDHPDAPPPHGLMGWLENDEAVFIYDKYDIWKCDPAQALAPLCITGASGRKNQITIRYVNTDTEEKFIKKNQKILLNLFDNHSKGSGWEVHTLGSSFRFSSGKPAIQQAYLAGVRKSKNAETIIFDRQTPSAVNIYQSTFTGITDSANATLISDLNPQQKQYNWFTVELLKWKMFDGKMSEGLLYKPENFDPSKKYPVIFYFYEKNADNRFRYIEPMPVRASVNIAYYTSNGYVVFDPNIYYKTGQPGDDAYNSVVSAAKHLARFKWVDSTKMGLQGHSWGGYQIAYIVTRTNMFAAAEAGAPVSNMTSAYGGIRWGTGISRQFQYERTQSRLGATLWQKPDLYIKNSPLFKADKIKTPLLILHNDKDDAVPWYQGIELFSAMRRLGKPVWMVNYNDELHGIIERRNRKDWTIRMAQFFDHYLKGTPAPRWMAEGIPATKKGIDWGLSD